MTDERFFNAIQEGDAATVKTFLPQHKDAVKGNGWPALVLAACYNQLEVVRLLLSAGCDIDKATTDESGTTALYTGSWNGHLEAVRALAAAGADLNKAKTTDSCTPLMGAAYQGHLPCVKALVGIGADTTLKGKYGTALDLAKNADKNDVAAFLGDAAAMEAERQRWQQESVKAERDSPVAKTTENFKNDQVDRLGRVPLDDWGVEEVAAFVEHICKGGRDAGRVMAAKGITGPALKPLATVELLEKLGINDVALCARIVAELPKFSGASPAAPPAPAAAAPAPAEARPPSAKRLPTPRKLGNRPMADWDEDECIVFLKMVCRYSQYEEQFRSEGIRGKDLVKMDDDILKELGIEKKLHRGRILEEIAALKAATSGDDTRGGRSKAAPSPAPALASCGYKRKRALIVGIDQYHPGVDMKPLGNAVRDATALKASLLKHAFAEEDIKLLTNEKATQKAIHKAMYETTAFHRRDLLVIAFFCHGLRIKVGNVPCGFVVPADAESKDPSELYKVEDFESMVEKMDVNHVLLVCDFCYSGMATTRSDSTAPSDSRDPAAIAKQLGKRARWVISSGSADEEVSDGKKGGNSPFLTLFVDALGQDKFTPTQILEYISNNIKGQTPAFNGLPLNGGHQLFMDLPALGDKITEDD